MLTTEITNEGIKVRVFGPRTVVGMIVPRGTLWETFIDEEFCADIHLSLDAKLWKSRQAAEYAFLAHYLETMADKGNSQ